jgi:hypothetical protein
MQYVIEVAAGQRPIRSQQVHDFHQKMVQPLAVLSRFFTPVISLESARVFNSPHSGSREDPKDRGR